ncbi:response regulator transcription factor [Kitasatospora sp. HPMI-4]|uniref:response regulator transcription factor n=1 Tax=Kitasatospora sp. HPMI-4 TaxID=3448443 RepID=UPI003F19E97C
MNGAKAEYQERRLEQADSPVYSATAKHNSPDCRFGWSSLTPAELRVARLVSEGLTNRAVARALAVSPHTVDSHLRHVYVKLSISSRVSLAALVLRHEFLGATQAKTA